MGLFSSKKKTRVHTQIQRMVDNNLLPDTAKTSVIKAVMSSDIMASIPQYVIDGFTSSIAIKADRAYKYARDHYPYGLPTVKLDSTVVGQDVVKLTIEDQIGHPITIDYFAYGPINSLHLGWREIVGVYGYNDATNELLVLSGTNGSPTYLKDLRVVITEDSFEELDPSSLAQWGPPATKGFAPSRPAQGAHPIGQFRSPSGYIVDSSAGANYVEMLYEWQATITTPNGPEVWTYEGRLTIPLTDAEDEEDYYQVRYRYMDGGEEQVGYWLYKDGSGEHPLVDAIHRTEYSSVGSYYPFIYYRHDKQNRGDESLHTTEEYKSSVKLCDYLGFDYQEMVDRIHENPDIGDVEQAMTVFAVNIEGTTDIEQRYLFDYFSTFYAMDNVSTPIPEPGSAAEALWQTLNSYGRRNGRAIRIEDREFAMTFAYDNITRRRYAGKIGAVGSHAAGRGTHTDIWKYQTRTTPGGPVTVQNQEITTDYYYFRRQISESFFDEVRVYRPQLTYHIYGKYNYTAGFGADEILVPLDHEIVDLYNMSQREKLYSVSLHFVFNTRITEKVKWYQSGWFKIVMVIVAIVIMYFTGFDAYSSLYAAAGGGAAGAAAVAMAVLESIVVGMVIQYGLKLVVDALGGELGMILAAVAAVYAIASGIQAGSIKGAPWAQELLQVSNGLTKATQEYYAEAISELQEDYAHFGTYVDEATKELERAQALLTQSAFIDPFEFIGLQPIYIPGETPQDFFNRTVHSGNIGLLAIDAVSGYVDNALALPRLPDTLELGAA